MADEHPRYSHPLLKLLYGKIHLEPDPLSALAACYIELCALPETHAVWWIMPFALGIVGERLYQIGHPAAENVIANAGAMMVIMGTEQFDNAYEALERARLTAQGASAPAPQSIEPAKCEPRPRPEAPGARIVLSNGEMVRVPPTEGCDPFPMYFYDRSRKN